SRPSAARRRAGTWSKRAWVSAHGAIFQATASCASAAAASGRAPWWAVLSQARLPKSANFPRRASDMPLLVNQKRHPLNVSLQAIAELLGEMRRRRLAKRGQGRKRGTIFNTVKRAIQG